MNKLMTNQKGFTLIELMIVVGIIGILVAIAAPNFARYQSKARQSEAKIALAAVYGAEKSFYSEYNAYVSSMNAIGYAPEGARRFYNVGWNAAATANSVSAFIGGDYTVGNFAAVNNPFTCTNTTAGLPANTGNDSQTFTAGTSGCIRDGAANLDRWTITELKIITNNQIAL